MNETIVDADNEQEVINYFRLQVIALDKINIDIPNIPTKEVVIQKINEIQIIYENFAYLVDILLDFNDDITIQNLYGEDVKIREYSNKAHQKAELIQFKYLFPLTLKLSEFSENESITREKKYFRISRNRDYLVFGLSLLLSFILGLFAPKISNNISFLKDDKVVIELDVADLQLKNQKLNEEKKELLLKDSLQYKELEQVYFKNDSLIKVNELTEKSSENTIKLFSNKMEKKQKTIDSLQVLINGLSKCK